MKTTAAAVKAHCGSNLQQSKTYTEPVFYQSNIKKQKLFTFTPTDYIDLTKTEATIDYCRNHCLLPPEQHLANIGVLSR